VIADVLARAAAAFPDVPAVECSGATTSYRETAARVAAAAALLRASGLGPGDRVALLAPNSRLFLESCFAAAHAGLVLVPLNWRAHPEGLARVVAHSGARRLIVAPRFQDLGERTLAASPSTSVELDLADARRDDRIARHAPIAPHASRPDDAAQLYYTSGTTGEPKGVVLTHRNVVEHAKLAIAALELSERDVWAHVAPMFHLADAWATFAITAVGGRHLMLPEFDVERVLDTLERTTITNLVPTMLGDLVHASSAATRRYPRLRRVLSGGAPIAPALVAKIVATFRCDYVQTYGLTETSPYLTLSLLPPHLAKLPDERRFQFVCKTGRPMPGVEVRVVRDDGSEVRRDGRDVGEVVCRGPTVTPGYWQNPSATAAAFRDGWLLTGDLATVDAEGFLQIVDRKKDVIKTGGESVFSTEVEQVLYAHPAVQEAAVVGLPDERWGERVVAVVVARAGSRVDEAGLLEHCRAHLGGPQVPKRVFFRSALPRTGSGKIAKRLLRDELAGRAPP
jgi:acyl-CoA synthetase (AMP-forming)/AMP-acid ligase II